MDDRPLLVTNAAPDWQSEPDDAPKRFDFVSKLAQFPQRIEAVRRADFVGALSTVYLDLNTDICNHNCIFCDGFYRTLRAGHFPWSRLSRLFDEMEELGVLSVVLAGDRGEPMMHPDIRAILDRLNNSPIRFAMYTNGTTPKVELLPLLGGAAWVRVSADAATARTHQAMHQYPAQRPDFDRLVANVAQLAGQNADLGISFILDPINYQEAEAAADLFLSLGARFIEYKPKYLPNYVLDVAWLASVADSLREQLSAARSKWGHAVQVNNQVAGLLDTGGQVENLTIAPRPCRTSLLRLVISTHGCYSCTPFRGEQERAVGDIMKNSLREVVESAARRALLDLPCSRVCCYHAQNQALLKLDAGQPFPGSPALKLDDQAYFI